MFNYNIAGIRLASDTNVPADFDAYAADAPDGFDLLHSTAYTERLEPEGELILSWPLYKVYRSGGAYKCYYYVQDALGREYVNHCNTFSADGREIRSYQADGPRRERFNLIGIFYEFTYCALKLDVMTFHSVAVEHEGECVLFTAPSGVGKTTQARFWKRHFNSLILNGDSPVLRLHEGLTRVYGTPWAGTSGEHIERSAPLKAIVILERGSKNQIRESSFNEQLGALYPQVIYAQWDGAQRLMAMRLLDKLIGGAKVYVLTCKAELEAAELARTAIYGR